MKKITSLVVMLGIAGAMNAQLVSKKGENYLPQAGDWSIGVDGGSMVNYFGNMLNNSAGNGLSFDYTNLNSMITGKMFKTDKMAYRGALRIGMNSHSETTPVAAASGTGTVNNVTKTSSSNIGLGAGIEQRRGSTRLQGYYGAMAVIDFKSGVKTTNTYGNGADAAAGNITESKDGSTFGLGVRGFIGAEYFVLPKISLAGEFGWGLGFSTTGATSTTIGNVDGTTTTAEGSKSSGFVIDTDNKNMGLAPAGNLMINFHF